MKKNKKKKAQKNNVGVKKNNKITKEIQNKNEKKTVKRITEEDEKKLAKENAEAKNVDKAEKVKAVKEADAKKEKTIEQTDAKKVKTVKRTDGKKKEAVKQTEEKEAKSVKQTDAAKQTKTKDATSIKQTEAVGQTKAKPVKQTEAVGQIKAKPIKQAGAKKAQDAKRVEKEKTALIRNERTDREKNERVVKKIQEIEIEEITEDIVTDNIETDDIVTEDSDKTVVHKTEMYTGQRQEDKEPGKDKKKGRKKKKTWKEQIFTCPYLIIVAATSLAAMVCSDKIGIRAVAREAQTVALETMGRDVSTQEYASDPAAGYMSEESELLQKEDGLEKESTGEKEEPENAGECKEQDGDKVNESALDSESGTDEETDNTEETPIGLTKFETYEPQVIDSRYYSDAGKIALTTEYPYTKEDTGYFKDAAFLGDSRTLGISDYAGLDEADFYCDSGMTIFKLLQEDGVTYQKAGSKVNLPQVLQEKQYGKIYIMLGMNELGYGNTEMYLEQYSNVVNQIREWQPEAIIYIMANLHVSQEKNNLETEFNNININAKNAASATLANGTDIFYLDANPLFTDAEGFLNAEMSFDGVHLYAQHYDAWKEFLLEHAVEPVEVAGSPDEAVSDIMSENN